MLQEVHRVEVDLAPEPLIGANRRRVDFRRHPSNRVEYDGAHVRRGHSAPALTGRC